ncbi:MAG: hypothetical protein WD708_01695 [Kiritimatiellia bacterium]
MKSYNHRLEKIESAAAPPGMTEMDYWNLNSAIRSGELSEIMEGIECRPITREERRAMLLKPDHNQRTAEALFRGRPELEAKCRARVAAWEASGSKAWIWQWVEKNPDPECGKP